MTGEELLASFWRKAPRIKLHEVRNNMAWNRKLSPTEMDDARVQAEMALAQLPDDAVKTLANWWNQWYGTAGHRRLGRLLLSRKAPIPPKYNEHGVTYGSGPEDESNGQVVNEGLRYTLMEAPLDSAAFFDVREMGGEVRIVLNAAHPAYPVIKASLEKADENGLPTSFSATILMLRAWADVEHHQPAGARKHRAREAREDWGRATRDLLTDPEADCDG